MNLLGRGHPHLYWVWKAMRGRCNNPKNYDYKWYGACGITVCDRWAHFKEFFEDMGGSYQRGLDLDRQDNTKGYYRENCRWITHKKNTNNTRATHHVTYLGETKPLTEWVYLLKLNYSTTVQRLYKYGLSPDIAFTAKSLQRQKMITCWGQTKSLQDWSSDTGLPKHTINQRIAFGWPVEKALTQPSRYAKAA
jgi:hypothetical protein